MQQLLLLHGALGARDQFATLVKELEGSYLVHSMNFSGHGGQPMPEQPFSIPLFANDVQAYMEKNAITRTNIFGYSMGGYVAMYLAKNYPGAVQKVATLASKFDWTPAVATKEAGMLNAETLMEKVPAFAEQLKDRHAPNDWKDLLQRTRMMLQALGENNTLRLPDYKTIVQPCLLMVGDKDRMVSVDETAAVSASLPNAGYRILPATPHPLEQVDIPMLANELRLFLL